jgi:cytochrome c oxidase subunit 2
MYLFNKIFMWGFQDPASPIMEAIVDLHNYIMFYLISIVIFVFSMMALILLTFYYDQTYPQKESVMSSRLSLLKINRVVHGTVIEIVWTITPSIILMLIAVPSFALLYSMDEVIDPAINLKLIGHQWYWSYEYSDTKRAVSFEDSKTYTGNVAFDSYMIPDDELKFGQLRLLEVDNEVVLPVDTHIRVLITAADVLHSWAVPALGVKMDAVPGRLNQVSLFIKRPGVYYGQCSELCGVNHGFMPISVHAVSMKQYLLWLKSMRSE